MSLEVLQRELSAAGITVRRSVAGSSLTTFAIGGPLACLIEPDSPAELQKTCALLKKHGLDWLVLGNGSNLLLPDGGLARCVLKLGPKFRYLKTLSSEEGLFEVGGSYGLMPLSRELSELGFSGLEFAGGIPASLGGALRMNAGAYGGQMADVLVGLKCVDSGGALREVRKEELKFGYRENSLPGDWLIYAAVIRLSKDKREVVMERRARYLAERKARQPLAFPSAGSVFKNPAREKSAGFLIEQAGLKGKRSGNAVISELHANWILNPEKKAGDRDVLTLIELCQERVKAAFSIDLKLEIAVWR